MSQTFAAQTFIELVFAGLLIYGFMHEDKVIAFEQAAKRIVLGHYRRIKRKLLHRIIDRKVLKISGKISFNKHSA